MPHLPPKVADALINLVDAAELKDGASVVEELGNTLEVAADYIESFDTTELPTSLQITFRTVVDKLQAAKQQVEVASAELKKGQELTDHPDEGVPSVLRRLVEQHDQEKGEDSYFESKKEQGGSHKDPFAHIRSHPKYKKHFDLRDAALKGDHSYIISQMQSYINRPGVHQHFHGRRAAAVSRAEQCETLVRCAEGLTLFDLVVYFYSDDIDFDAGEFNDATIIGFDETIDIFAKGANISARTDTAKSSGYSDTECDELLEEFHRIEEDGDNVFAWKGGVVTEVCIASGTVEHVRLESIEENVGESVSDLIFEDVLLCSKQLFDSRDSRFSTETEFVFVDPVTNTLRLPTGVVQDSSNRDIHGKPKSFVPTNFFTFRSISAGEWFLLLLSVWLGCQALRLKLFPSAAHTFLLLLLLLLTMQ